MKHHISLFHTNLPPLISWDKQRSQKPSFHQNVNCIVSFHEHLSLFRRIKMSTLCDHDSVPHFLDLKLNLRRCLRGPNKEVWSHDFTRMSGASRAFRNNHRFLGAWRWALSKAITVKYTVLVLKLNPSFSSFLAPLDAWDGLTEEFFCTVCPGLHQAI